MVRKLMIMTQVLACIGLMLSLQGCFYADSDHRGHWGHRGEHYEHEHAEESGVHVDLNLRN